MMNRRVGPYTIVEKLGEGGMGVVYKAHDERLNRFVALKVLAAEQVSDPDCKRRFTQEARSASALNHPNIVHIYDIFSDEGAEFIAMECVQGKTLGRLIGRKGLGLDEALRYAVQIADAFSKAHAAGIVHRDLKPSNIMINEDGAAKILDFGLAKLTERDPSAQRHPDATAETVAPTLTEEGTIVGTVAYMSPEQAEGKNVDARSDIFSFGSVLYEILTGQRAFQGDSKASTLAAVIQSEPKHIGELIPALPQEMQRLIARCLRKDPARRWQTMSDLKVALQELKEDSDSGRLSGGMASAPRRRISVGLVAVITFVTVASAAALTWWALHRASAPREVEMNRLTYDSGLTRYSTISPDGKLVAYASDCSGEGNLDIYVQQVGGREAIRRTSHPADDIQPSFSPDGSKIAFRSERNGGGIYIIDTLGGPERKIADRGWHPSFSPDGSQILYTEATSIGAALGTSSRMYLIPSTGGSARELQPDFMVESYAGTGPVPLWSPDGTRFYQ